MARKPSTAEQTIHDTPDINPDVLEAANTLSVLQTDYDDARDLANHQLTKILITSAYEDFSRTVRISELLILKESKGYQNLKGVKIPHRAESLNGTWDDFCQKVLRRSVDQVDRDISNLKAFGEEALDSMTNAGIGYRELRQFRKLPEDQKTALIEVAKEGDKDSLIELAEDLIAKHTKEKEELKKKVDDTQADYNALQKRNTDISKEKEEMGLKLSKYELKTIPMDERISPFKEQIAQTQSQIDGLFNEYRQFVDLMEQMQFEIAESDTDYDPESPLILPEAIQTALLMLNSAVVLTQAQIKAIHRDLWLKFGDSIDMANARLDEAINETRNEIH